MSEDEILATAFGFAIALMANAFWMWTSRAGSHLGRARPWPARLLWLTPLPAAATLVLLLNAFGDEFVRGSTRYIAMYALMGLAWVPVAAMASGWLGVSLRDDVGERANPAAAVVHFASYMGLTLAFAGGNFGDGPGWWVVVFSALLATLGFYAVWVALEMAVRPSELVAVDRDLNAALRAAGVLLGAGLLMGRAVAGDWVGPRETLDEFWPIASLAFVPVGVEVAVSHWVAKKPTNASRLLFGVLPGAGTLGLAALLCAMKGPW